MRDIRFRAWDKIFKRWVNLWQLKFANSGQIMAVQTLGGEIYGLHQVEVTQYTGLKDKTGLTDIYECDIIGVDGIVRGNKYENASLLRDETNLVIQGFGTSAWEATNQEAVGRGCKYSE